MDKAQLDELYHLLRVVSNTPRNLTQTIPIQSIIYGLSRHLLAGLDYLALVQYSAYYGEKFLIAPTAEAIKDSGWGFSRIVEFGAGLSWLSRGLSREFNFCPTMNIDKRSWTMIDVVADLETEQGITRVMDEMRKKDLIVMSDFLHCLEDPVLLTQYFINWPIVALEYSPANPEYVVSYSTQIARYGANPFAPDELEIMFPGRETKVIDFEPYVIVLAERGNRNDTPKRGEPLAARVPG